MTSNVWGSSDRLTAAESPGFYILSCPTKDVLPKNFKVDLAEREG